MCLSYFESLAHGNFSTIDAWTIIVDLLVISNFTACEKTNRILMKSDKGKVEGSIWISLEDMKTNNGVILCSYN